MQSATIEKDKIEKAMLQLKNERDKWIRQLQNVNINQQKVIEYLKSGDQILENDDTHSDIVDMEETIG